MAIIKTEIRPKKSDGTYDDVLYPKTSTDMVDGLQTELTNRVTKTQIKNTLTETVAGNVLDATQGKALNDQISLLSTNKADKTYVDTQDTNLSNQISVLSNASYGSTIKTITNTNLDTFKNDGEYWVNGDTCSNIPISLQWGKLKVKKLNDSNLWQEYSHHAHALGIYTRICNNGIWSVWKQLATSDEMLKMGYPTAEGANTADVDNLKTSRVMHIINGSNVPVPQIPHGILEVYDGSSGYAPDVNSVFQRFTVQNSGDVYTRTYLNSAWQPWKLLATTDKIDILTTDLKNAWVIDNYMTVEKIGNKVFLTGTVKDGTKTNGTIILNIPTTFRPTKTAYLGCDTKNSSTNPTTRVQVRVHTDGNVSLLGNDCNSFLLFDMFWEV